MSQRQRATGIGSSRRGCGGRGGNRSTALGGRSRMCLFGGRTSVVFHYRDGGTWPHIGRDSAVPRPVRFARRKKRKLVSGVQVPDRASLLCGGKCCCVAAQRDRGPEVVEKGQTRREGERENKGSCSHSLSRCSLGQEQDLSCLETCDTTGRALGEFYRATVPELLGSALPDKK